MYIATLEFKNEEEFEAFKGFIKTDPEVEIKKETKNEITFFFDELVFPEFPENEDLDDQDVNDFDYEEDVN